AEGDFYSKKPLPRLLAVSGGVLFNLLLGIVLLSFAGMLPSMNVYLPPVVYIPESLSTQPAYQAGLRSFDEILKINGKEIYSFTDLQTIISQIMGEKLTIEYKRDGQISTVTIVPNVERNTGRSVIGVYPYIKPVIDTVETNSIFKDIGLEKGDLLISVKNEKNISRNILSTADLSEFLESHLYENITFTFQKKDGTIIEKSAFVDKQFDPGLNFYVEYRKTPGLPFYKSFIMSFPKSIDTLDMFIKSLRLLFSGKVDVSQSVSGPVKLIYISSKVVQTGLKNVLEFFALLTLILGATNLLPIPATDGSYILFFLFELISRKKLNPKTISKIQTVGFFLLLALMILVFINDIITIKDLF
ncbi:MAG TPA: RIP metalloprotease RseP, partial [Exilispira sp.]|nr:RIP metalloprotease RseP [Exilispira sp.]